jgi:hypothetical protein
MDRRTFIQRLGIGTAALVAVAHGLPMSSPPPASTYDQKVELVRRLMANAIQHHDDLIEAELFGLWSDE